MTARVCLRVTSMPSSRQSEKQDANEGRKCDWQHRPRARSTRAATQSCPQRFRSRNEAIMTKTADQEVQEVQEIVPPIVQQTSGQQPAQSFRVPSVIRIGTDTDPSNPACGGVTTLNFFPSTRLFDFKTVKYPSVVTAVNAGTHRCDLRSSNTIWQASHVENCSDPGVLSDTPAVNLTLVRRRASASK